MPYRLAADATLILHLAFILFAVAGGLLALVWRWLPAVHLPAAAWAAWIELAGGACPLTALENRFLRAAGEAGYQGSFVEHYLWPLIYPSGLTREIQWVLAGIVVAVNVVIYVAVWRARRGLRPPHS